MVSNGLFPRMCYMEHTMRLFGGNIHQRVNKERKQKGMNTQTEYSYLSYYNYTVSNPTRSPARSA